MGVKLVLSYIIREKHKLRMSENGVLRKIFGPKREEWQEAGEDYIMRSFITCML
jgi:hypothetical protein